MKSNAQLLVAAQARRAETGEPEGLLELLDRVRFAAEWNQKEAVKARGLAVGFNLMSRDEKYTEAQRDDATYAAADHYAKAHVRDDAARTLDSIADSLCTLVGKSVKS